MTLPGVGRFLFLALALFLVQAIMAQEESNVLSKDFESWTSATFNYSLNTYWKVDLNQQLRLKENSSQVDVYFTQLGIRYKLNNNLFIAGGLRYIRENDNKGKIQGYENHFRWNGDLMYKLSIQGFSMKNRLRYQSKTELNVSDAIDRSAFRIKTGLSYNIKKTKFAPWLSSELFHDPNLENEINKIRYTIGISYFMKNIGKLSTFYRFEDKLSKISPKQTHIIGLKYEYSTKKR